MQANDTLEQQKREFQMILSKFSHEIRNPIALISSELQLMASFHPEVFSYKCWDDIMENLEYVSQLLKEMSNYNNAENLHPVPTDFNDFLRTILASVRPTLDYLGIHLESHLSPGLPTLPVDQIKLRQALLNLLRNAQESISGSEGRITVNAYATSCGLCISIGDNGCGMDTEQIEHIFQPFVTYKSGGTGLGLAITRQIIEAHNGELQVESKLHEGTIFRIILSIGNKQES